LDSLIINGGASLKGQVKISGAKNAVLPIMAASILSSSEVVLSEVPDLEDIKVMSECRHNEFLTYW
jgi:UDP-N-acetylglucosamine 1-carboxyvinyltransferase